MDVGECFAGPSPDCLGEPQPPIEHAFCGPDVDNTYCIFDDYFSGYCIVGESFHGYLRSPDGSSFTTIDVPGAFYTYAKGVNGAGQIVGRFEPGGAEVAFRRDTDGSFTTIDVPGACCSGAEGINDSGQIVGRFTDNTSYTTHGFLRSPDGSNFTIIDVPGASSTYAYGVNGAGQVVGSFQDARGGHGFLRDTDGSFTTIDVPGAMSSEANGINATGQIVGTFQDATGDHGFLRGTDASFTTIHVPGALGTAAAGINDTSQIAGTFTDASNVGHGFVASPFGPSSGGGAGSGDTSSPAVSVTSPIPGATVSGAITVFATASDNVGVAGVQFKLDSANLGAEVSVAPYVMSWDTRSAANGAHTLTAVARDAAWNIGTAAPVSVTVANDNIAPTVSIRAPVSGATVRGTITVAATATDNVSVAGVQFKLDGVNLGAEVTTAPYVVSWNTTTVLKGAHTLTAVARDAADNASISSAVTVTVKNRR